MATVFMCTERHKQATVGWMRSIHLLWNKRFSLESFQPHMDIWIISLICVKKANHFQSSQSLPVHMWHHVVVTLVTQPVTHEKEKTWNSGAQNRISCCFLWAHIICVKTSIFIGKQKGQSQTPELKRGEFTFQIVIFHIKTFSCNIFLRLIR